MPLFVIHCIDKPNSLQLRLDTRAQHLDHVQALGDGLVAAGPYLAPDGSPKGSMIIIDVPDQAAAESFASEDPYNKAGLFSTVTVTAWRKVLPAN